MVREEKSSPTSALQSQTKGLCIYCRLKEVGDLSLVSWFDKFVHLGVLQINEQETGSFVAVIDSVQYLALLKRCSAKLSLRVRARD